VRRVLRAQRRGSLLRGTDCPFWTLTGLTLPSSDVTAFESVHVRHLVVAPLDKMSRHDKAEVVLAGPNLAGKGAVEFDEGQRSETVCR
jgi:hypothetical protein